MKDALILDALDFAADAHKDQVRKYSEEPYIFHPVEVAQIVWSVLADPEATAAALLHDVVEDTHVTEEQIRTKFGDRVADLVMMVTKPSKPEDGVRAIRKEMDRVHYAKGDSAAQTIKLADVISNTADVVDHDPRFAKVYLLEQEDLVNSLTLGDPMLFASAVDAVATAKEVLKKSEGS